MPTFSFTAIEAGTGNERHGTIAGTSREDVAMELKNRGLAPIALAVDPLVAPPLEPRVQGRSAKPMQSPTSRPRRPRRRIVIGRPVGPKELTLFTRQLAILVRAGMPLLRALEVVARPERNPAFKEAMESLAGTVRSGGNFSDGLQQHPRIFDRLYISMVKAGEAGGVLDMVLERLARFRERTGRIKGRVKAAMTYPAIIVVVAGSILGGLMVFVIPKFEQIFGGLLKGQPLPKLTRLVLGAANFVSHHIVWAVGLVVVIWVASQIWRKTRFGARLADWVLIKAPVMGDLFLKAAIARFTRTFGSLLASGVPILEALMITRDTSGNLHVAEALHLVHERVKGGDTVARSLSATGLFPELVTSMVEVGEETGALSEILGRIADTYDEEVDNAVVAVASIVEPVMIVLMGIVVGFIVVALFLPIVGIVQHLQ